MVRASEQPKTVPGLNIGGRAPLLALQVVRRGHLVVQLKVNFHIFELYERRGGRGIGCCLGVREQRLHFPLLQTEQALVEGEGNLHLLVVTVVQGPRVRTQAWQKFFVLGWQNQRFARVYFVDEFGQLLHVWPGFYRTVRHCDSVGVIEQRTKRFCVSFIVVDQYAGAGRCAFLLVHFLEQINEFDGLSEPQRTISHEVNGWSFVLENMLQLLRFVLRLELRQVTSKCYKIHLLQLLQGREGGLRVFLVNFLFQDLVEVLDKGVRRLKRGQR